MRLRDFFRHLLTVTFCMMLVTTPAFSSAAWNIQPVNTNLAKLAITSSQDTIVFTNTNGQPRVVTLISDVAWGFSDASAAYVDMFPIPASTKWTIRVTEVTKTYYVRTASTSGSLYCYVLDNR